MSDVILEDVSKYFGSNCVIENTSLKIKSGEFVVIVGPSGCGKSTILRLIAGLEAATSGSIHIGGKCVNDVQPAKRQVAMVFQSYALYPHMNVFNNMSFGLRMANLSKGYIKEKILKVAKMLELEDMLMRKPKELSGGQRQRVAIGRALARDPSVCLFDEPLSNLDAKLRSKMRTQLIELHRKIDATMIYVTHDQIEAMTMADRIVVVRDGKIEQYGTPFEIYNNPRNKFVAGFMGSPQMNFIPSLISSTDDNKAEVIVGGKKVKLNFAVESNISGIKGCIGVRPGDIKLTLPYDLKSSNDNTIRLKGKLHIAEFLGEACHYILELPSGEQITVEDLSYTNCDICHKCVDIKNRPGVNGTKQFPRNKSMIGSEFAMEIDINRCHLFNENDLSFEREVRVGQHC